MVSGKGPRVATRGDSGVGEAYGTDTVRAREVCPLGKEKMMRSSRRSLSFLFICVVLLMPTSATTALGDGVQSSHLWDSLATERLDGGQLSFEIHVPFETAVLSLTGPGTRVSRHYVAGEEIVLALKRADERILPNGRYSFTLRVSPQPQRGIGTKAGVFYMKDGSAVSREAWRGELGRIRQTLNLERQARLEQARAEWVKPRTEARPTRSAEQPTPARKAEAGLAFAETDFRYGVAIYDSYPSNPYLLFYEYADGQYRYAGGVYGAGYYGSPSGIFYPSLYTYGYWWNTVSAGHGNRIFSPFNEISANTNWEAAIFSFQIGTQFIDNYSFYAIHETAGGAGFFPTGLYYPGHGGGIFSTAYAATYVTPTAVYGPYGGLISMMSIDYYNGLDSGLYVTPAGVGVQTYSPAADLEIYDPYDFAAMRLNNAIATFAFAVNPYGEFTVNKIGSGGQEFSVNTRLDAQGPTMKIQGSVQGTQFIANSSRTAKTDFQPIDGKEVLARMAEVPVMSWRFKTEVEDARHVGPVAEDFQAAFQLGDGRTISTMDAGGVTMAAVQGLYALLQEREKDLRELRTEMDREIAALRREVAKLESVRSEVAALRRAMPE
jgi:hypothetical protein